MCGEKSHARCGAGENPKITSKDYLSLSKTLEQVRPGGVIAYITSKGTMDKASPDVRRYIAQRAELLGAIRLPNTAFAANAGTSVTTDILFLPHGIRRQSSESPAPAVPLSLRPERVCMSFPSHRRTCSYPMPCCPASYRDGWQSSC